MYFYEYVLTKGIALQSIRVTKRARNLFLRIPLANAEFNSRAFRIPLLLYLLNHPTRHQIAYLQ